MTAKKVAKKTAKKVPAKAVKQAKTATKKAAPKKVATKPKAAALSARHRTFIATYLANGFNGTAAAIEAGYSARSAATQASRLLAMAKIAAAIVTKTEKVLAKREITAEWVLNELAKLAAFDVRKLYNPYGSLIPVTELDDETAAGIAGLEVIEQRGTGRGKKKQKGPLLKKYKLADKGQNLERLGRHFKLFTDKVEHNLDKEFVLTVRSILSGEKPSGEKKR